MCVYENALSRREYWAATSVCGKKVHVCVRKKGCNVTTNFNYKITKLIDSCTFCNGSFHHNGSCIRDGIDDVGNFYIYTTTQSREPKLTQ